MRVIGRCRSRARLNIAHYFELCRVLYKHVDKATGTHSLALSRRFAWCTDGHLSQWEQWEPFVGDAGHLANSASCASGWYWPWQPAGHPEAGGFSWRFRFNVCRHDSR